MPEDVKQSFAQSGVSFAKKDRYNNPIKRICMIRF